MNFDQLVDLVVEQAERVPATAAATAIKTRVASNVQRAIEAVDGFRSWHYKYRTAEIGPITIGDQPLLPANFKTMGIAGGVFLHEPGGKKSPLEYAPMWLYYRMRARNRRNRPTHYALGEGVTGSNDRYFFLEPLSAQAETVDLVYERALQRFGYGDEEAIEIPEHWHITVLYEWAFLFCMRDNANAQAVREQRQIAVEARAQMAKEEQHGREAVHHIAPYGAGVIFTGGA